jgi:hypothetical protein
MCTFYETVNYGQLVKSRETVFLVIPAKAGIQYIQGVTKLMDSGVHRSDDFLRDHPYYECTLKNDPQSYCYKG